MNASTTNHLLETNKEFKLLKKKNNKFCFKLKLMISNNFIMIKNNLDNCKWLVCIKEVSHSMHNLEVLLYLKNQI